MLNYSIEIVRALMDERLREAEKQRLARTRPSRRQTGNLAGLVRRLRPARLPRRGAPAPCPC